ncbi:hypothetical protein DRQ33_01905 [bacterium]|nr:MAG: hypothetical protein DRQ33_01905 [bacterium]
MKPRGQIIGIILGVFTMLCIIGIAFAQDMPFAQPSPEIMERIETLKMWKLTEALDLSYEQTAKLFPLLKETRQRQDSLMQQQKWLIEELIDATENDADTTEMLGIIDQIVLTRTNECQIQQEFYSELRNILSTRQQAEYILFEINFRKKMMELIREFHRGNQKLYRHKQNPWD